MPCWHGCARRTSVGLSVNTADVTVEQGNPAQLQDLAIGVFGFEGVRADAVRSTTSRPSASSRASTRTAIWSAW